MLSTIIHSLSALRKNNAPQEIDYKDKQHCTYHHHHLFSSSSSKRSTSQRPLRRRRKKINGIAHSQKPPKFTGKGNKTMVWPNLFHVIVWLWLFLQISFNHFFFFNKIWTSPYIHTNTTITFATHFICFIDEIKNARATKPTYTQTKNSTKNVNTKISQSNTRRYTISYARTIWMNEWKFSAIDVVGWLVGRSLLWSRDFSYCYAFSSSAEWETIIH